MKKLPYGKLIAIGLFLVSLFIVSSDDTVNYFRSLMEGSVVGPLAFVAILITAVVLAPIAALPLVPLASSLFGAFATALLSVAGYTAGAIIAYVLAQRIGRPVLRYFVSLEEIEKLEKRVPAQAEFWGVVLLRMVVPVDILSYALGLLSTMPLRTYALATLIGVAPFSFIFAYGGEALSEGSILTLAIIGIGGLVLYIYAWRRLRMLRKKDDGKS